MTPKFSQRHYEAIAAVLRKAHLGYHSLDELCRDFAEMLEEGQPKV